MAETKREIDRIKNGTVVRYDRLPPEWKMTNVGLDAVRISQASLSNTGVHGIYAGIPIICRGRQCPFIETCEMSSLHVDVETLKGQRCPVEISEILSLYSKYCTQFGIDEDCQDMTLIGLTKELIDYEIQIRRADHKMASQGDFLEDVVVGISDNGHPIINKEISKPIDFKERAIKRKHEILDLLNTTPKAKAGSKINVNIDPSSYASQLLAKARQLEREEIIDANEDDIKITEKGDE